MKQNSKSNKYNNKVNGSDFDIQNNNDNANAKTNGNDTNALNSQNKLSKSTFRRPRSRTGRRTKEMLAIAKERIRILLTMAEVEVINRNNILRSQRYVQLARNIGMRYNIRIDKYFKNKYCRTCHTYLSVSTTSSVRCRAGRMIITCKTCGRVKRIPIK